MRIKRLSIEQFKGVTRSVEITSDRVLFSGPMGSGKSAMLEGLHMALNLTTRFGQTDLGRLSPTGSWMAHVELADGAVRSLGRGVERGKGVYEVDGRRSDKSDYEEAAASILAVEPHHINLSAFLAMSGAARAALFADMLEDAADKMGVDDMLVALRRPPVAARAQAIGEAAMPAVRGLERIRGTAAQVVDAVKAAHNDARRADSDARVRLEGLAARQVRVSHSYSQAELQTQLSAVDTEIGGLATRKANIATERERYSAARRVVETAKRQVADIQSELDGLRARAGELEGTGRLLATARTTQANLAAQVTDAERQYAAAQQALEAAVAERQSIAHNIRVVNELLAAQWKVDRDWLAEEVNTLLAVLNIDVPPVQLTDPQHDAVASFAREVVTEALGGDQQRLREKLETADRSAKQAQEAVTAAAKALENARAMVRRGEEGIAALERTTAEIQTAAAKIPGLEAKLTAAEERRRQVEQSAAQAAVSEDEAVLDGQIEALGAKRTAIKAQMRELEEAGALSGQLEGLRRDVTAMAAVVDMAAGVLADVQVYRDQRLRDRCERVLTPFRESVQTVFGPDASVEHKSQGTGRSTEFQFFLRRGLHSVPLDTLSDGEAALAAVAFLHALQSIKPGPGRFLTIGGEPLSSSGLIRVCTVLGNGEFRHPLSFDFVGVASNWGWYLSDPDRGRLDSRWQVVRMGEKDQ